MNYFTLVLECYGIVLCILVVLQAPSNWTFLGVYEVTFDRPQPKYILTIQAHFVLIIIFLFHVKSEPLHDNFLSVDHKWDDPGIPRILCENVYKLFCKIVKSLGAHTHWDWLSFWILMFHYPFFFDLGSKAAKDAAQQ